MRKSLRRASGFLLARLKKLDFSVFSDPRKRIDGRCDSEVAVRAVLLGIFCGCRGLRELEAFLERLDGAVKKRFGLYGRLSDTTLRDWLCRLSHASARALLHQCVRAAHAAKALRPVGLPFGVLSMDGKATALPSWDEEFAQCHRREDGVPHGVVRTITSTLMSARGRPCLDALPVPAATNEVGFFRTAFDEVCQAFGHLFELVCYDAGANSEANARRVVEAGKDYLFAMNNPERHMEQLASELLHDRVPEAVVHNLECDRNPVKRTVRLFAVNRGILTQGKRVQVIWPHCRTLISLTTERTTAAGTTCETRYFCSSLEVAKLTPEQWIEVIVRRWSVETTHQILDVGFREDDRPWIENDPNAMLVVLMLRRLAYTMLALYRGVTLSADSLVNMSWPAFLQWMRDALIAADARQLRTLRKRRSPATA